ncbi:hypothetical protein RIF29_03622 [Crotalaria pallida]|uniref:Reverse transcriptase zinc-binding domain-containing protein n=1 Tax=Crotalaria pallida TaxID=3830 RepID=A0AAN9J0W0_CROPI
MAPYWPLVVDNRSVSIGNGACTFFLIDKWWGENFTLEEFFDPNFNPLPFDASVNQAIADDGEWNFPLLGNILPPHISNKIRVILHLDEDSGPDSLIWSAEDNGVFSIKSSYNLLANEKAWVSHMPWVTIWSRKGPEKYKIYFWKLSHDKLLTNKRKSSWGLSPLDCPFCFGLVEDSLHVMRDCYLATQV